MLRKVRIAWGVAIIDFKGRQYQRNGGEVSRAKKGDTIAISKVGENAKTLEIAVGNGHTEVWYRLEGKF